VPSALSIDRAWYERDSMRHLATQLYLSFQERQDHLRSESEHEFEFKPKQKPEPRTNPLSPHLPRPILPTLYAIKQRQPKNKIPALLNTGAVAVVPELAREGDSLCLLEGYTTLCLVRPRLRACNEQETEMKTLVARHRTAERKVMNVSWVFIVPFDRYERSWGWCGVAGGVEPEEVVFAIH